MRRSVLCVAGTFALVLALPTVASAQTATITRVSVATGGTQANQQSSEPAISGDGRYVAFRSEASNLVAGDTNGVDDVFVYDRSTGTTTRVSVLPDGTQGNLESGKPSISATGRYVVFTSKANTLVSGGGDTNNKVDVFVYDSTTKAVTRESLGPIGAQADDDSAWPAIDGDGRYVAFSSTASNLVSGDTNSQSDIFLRDRVAGTTTRVSVGPTGQANAGSFGPVISSDGRFIAYLSLASNLTSTADTNNSYDAFVYDRTTGINTRVSVSSTGIEANDWTQSVAISANGRYVAFSSLATNLVSVDANAHEDVFLHDRTTGATTLISEAQDGSQANDQSFGPTVSTDGRHVAFWSAASNLYTGDTNGATDVFVRDRQAGTISRVSVGLAGAVANSGSVTGPESISGDGRFIAFQSFASNLVSNDSNGADDIFVRDGGRRATVNDYDGDGITDVSVFRPGTGVWYVIRSSNGVATGIPWGLNGDIPVPADYDGDGKTDQAVWRPSEGNWYVIQTSTGNGVSLRWGVNGDIPVPADYDGDGKADPAVFRSGNGNWFIVPSAGSPVAVPWGVQGDVPVVGDYDGDGKADPTVWRPSSGTWYQLRSASGTGFGLVWGVNGDVPVAGDYDGDGKTDPTVFRPTAAGAWYQFRSASNTGVLVNWGANGDKPITGDYDGDGKFDPTVFRPSSSTWYQLRSITGAGFGVIWGQAGDVPLYLSGR